MNDRVLQLLEALVTARAGTIPPSNSSSFNDRTVALLAAAAAAPGSSIPTTFTRMALATAVNAAGVVSGAGNDPSSRLVTPMVDLGEGVGIETQLALALTSTATASLGEFPWVAWEIPTAEGDTLGGTDVFGLMAIVRIRTHPGDSSDTDLRVYLVNEADLASPTIDGWSGGIRWASAARASLNASGTNGAGATPTAGTGVAGAEIVQVTWTREGVGSSSVLLSPRTTLLDANGVRIASAAINTAPGTINTGEPTKWYIAVALGRSAVTVANATVRWDLYLAKPVGRSLPS